MASARPAREILRGRDPPGYVDSAQSSRRRAGARAVPVVALARSHVIWQAESPWRSRNPDPTGLLNAVSGHP